MSWAGGDQQSSALTQCTAPSWLCTTVSISCAVQCEYIRETLVERAVEKGNTLHREVKIEKK